MLGFKTAAATPLRERPAGQFAAHLAPPSGLPTHEQIAQRAYEIYEESGRAPDRSAQNWLAAERELLEETLDAEV